MDDQGTEQPINAGEQNGSYGSCNNIPPQKTGIVSWHKKIVPIEIVAFLSAFSSTICWPTIQFYVIGYINEEYSNSSTNGSYDMCALQQNGSNSILVSDRNDAETEKAHWFMYMSLTSSFSALLPTLLCGSLADKYGRKPFMAMSQISSIVRYLFWLAIIRFRLPIKYWLIGSAIEGMTGSFGIAFMIMMSMIADVTCTANQRAFRIIVAEAAVAVAFSAAEFIAAYWVRDESNFIYPISVSVGLNALALLYLILFIPETLDRTKVNKEGFRFKDCFKFIKIYTNKENKRRCVLNCFLVCFFLKTLAASMPFVLYIQNVPFCWRPFKITMAVAITAVFQWTVSLLGVKLLQNCLHLDQMAIAMIGCISSAADKVFFGIARLSEWLLYSTLVVGCMGNVIVPMIRAAMSRLVTKEEQGSMFAGVAVVERLTGVVASIMSNEVYALTLPFFDGTIFLLAAGQIVLVFILLLCLFVRSEKQN